MGEENLPVVNVVVTHDDVLLSPDANEKGILLNSTDDPEKAKPVEEREQWKDPVQFFMTFLGFCVGLGNIWRFPYLCQQNGGGAFVIPFLIMMLLEGMPILLLELGIGQKLRTGSLGVWKTIHPWLGGIGLGSTVIATIVGCYYNMIIAWCFYYFFRSFTLELPWSTCPEELLGDGSNTTVVIEECAKSSETQYFWYRTALGITEDIETFGGFQWGMLLCLILSWIIIFAIIMRGIQQSGKVVYFTALFPYVVMTIFFIRGLTLKGAGPGLAHMFLPKLESLLTPKVWLDAATQVFYSYGLGIGALISFGSYNDPKTNIVRDVYLLSACNAFTCVYACAVVFTILGFKAQHLFDKCLQGDVDEIFKTTAIWEGREPGSITELDYYNVINSDLALPGTLQNCSLQRELEQAAQGTGLAFIVMADVFTMLPASPLWSILFFSMLLSLGIGSEIGIMEGLIGTLFDLPQLKHIKKPILTGLSCLFCFLVGILFTTGSGEYWLALVDTYGAMGLTLIAFIEVIVVMYVYGHEKFTNDVEEMTGIKIGLYWQVTLRFIAPVVIFVILAASITAEVMKSPTYKSWSEEEGKSVSKPYPTWAIFLSIVLALASMFPIIGYAIVQMVKDWCKPKPDKTEDQELPLKETLMDN